MRNQTPKKLNLPNWTNRVTLASCKSRQRWMRWNRREIIWICNSFTRKTSSSRTKKLKISPPNNSWNNLIQASSATTGSRMKTIVKNSCSTHTTTSTCQTCEDLTWTWKSTTSTWSSGKIWATVRPPGSWKMSSAVLRRSINSKTPTKRWGRKPGHWWIRKGRNTAFLLKLRTILRKGPSFQMRKSHKSKIDFTSTMSDRRKNPTNTSLTSRTSTKTIRFFGLIRRKVWTGSSSLGTKEETLSLPMRWALEKQFNLSLSCTICTHLKTLRGLSWWSLLCRLSSTGREQCKNGQTWTAFCIMTKMVSLAEEASNIISGITSISPWKEPLFPQNSINSKFSSPATKSFSWITTMSSWTYPSSSLLSTRPTDWRIKMRKFCQLWKDCPAKEFCCWLERPFKTILDSFGVCLIIFILRSLAPTKISEDRLETYLRMSRLKN